MQGRPQGRRSQGDRHVWLGPVDHLGRLCGGQVVQGRVPLQQSRPQRAPLHGQRGGRLHAHLRHRRTDGLLRRSGARRRVRAVGCQHGGDAPDPVVAPDRPAPHRKARQAARAVHLHPPLLRTGGRRADLQAADRPGDPELHLQPHHPEQCGESGFRRQACELQARRHRHRLRAAAEPPAGAGGEQQRLPRCRRQAQGQPEQFR